MDNGEQLLSAFSQSSTHSDFGSSSADQSETIENSSTGSGDGMMKDDGIESTSSAPAFEEYNKPKEEQIKELTEVELNETIQIKLSETETHTLFSMPSVCVSAVDPNAAIVTEMNEKYTKLKEDKATSDLFTSDYIQTDGFPSKSKDVQVSPAPTKEMCCQATSWDIYDSSRNYENLETMTDTAGNTYVEAGQIQMEAEKEVEVVLASKGCLLTIDDGAVGSKKVKQQTKQEIEDSEKVDGKEVIQLRKRDEILASELLKKDLDKMDCFVQQNIVNSKLLEYRGISFWDSIIQQSDPTQLFQAEADANANPSLDKLWTYTIPLCDGYDIVDMTWNPSYPDLLAVGYGQVDYASKKDGMIMFWSLKNPSYPLKILYLRVPVSALRFSKQTPYLLAVGTYEGSVELFDIRREENDPVIVSTDINSKHSEAIWKMRWVDMGSEKGEVLVSISSDSKVKEWNIKRGLVAKDLMTLKRYNNPNGSQWKPPEIKGDSLLPRISGGCSFDFPENDASTYYVGTENGTVHRCSCSYNEQYLQNYLSHSAPVYQLTCSTFDPSIFFTCSADSRINIWDAKLNDPLVTMQSPDGSDAINDISFLPYSSTVFASVSAEGRIDVWDIYKNVINPLITEYTAKTADDGNNENNKDGSASLEKITLSSIKHISLNKVLFGINTPVLLTGDNDGKVTVYRVNGIETQFTRTEHVTRLQKGIHPE